MFQKYSPEILAKCMDGTFFGAVDGMPNEIYHSLEKYWSSTQLKFLISNSPLHFHDKYILKNKDRNTACGENLILGSTCHCLLLSPTEFDEEFVVMPELNLKTKLGRAERDALIESSVGKRVIKPETHAEARRIVSRVWSNNEAEALLGGSKTEVAFFWRCPYSGLLMRAKLDAMKEYSGVWKIIEYKTADDGSPEEFVRTCDRYHYDLSLVHYGQGLQANGFGSPQAPEFIVSETSDPYACAVYPVHDLMLDVGHAKWLHAVDMLSNCLKNDFWPGYKLVENEKLRPSPWTLKKWNVPVEGTNNGI